jgi:PAS domain S-box-containing protein
LAERALQVGVERAQPIARNKKVRLCNLLALWGSAIMVPWIAVEALFGHAPNLLWELGFLAGFLIVLALEGLRAHRAARLLLIVLANLCVLAGALMFEPSAGGTLPFFALVALPLVLFGSADGLMLGIGALLPALLFAVSQFGAPARWLSIHPQPAPSWYFAANVITAFAIAFVVPFFFYRSNLKAEASLERIGREKLKRVIDTNLIGVVRARLSGSIEEANDTFLALLGYTRQDLASGAINLKTLAPLDVSCARALAELSERGVSSIYERTLRRKDGASVPALIGVALLDDSHDELVGFVLDLTAQKRIEAQEARLRENQEALRLNDLFNSIASHELKTPLTALMLNLKMLERRLDKDGAAPSGLRSQVERCELSAARMGDLIHTLLDGAQVHDGKLTLSVHDMDVVEAVRRIASGFEVNRNGGCQPIEVQAEGVVTARLDPLRFDQIITNLLSNAVKYGAGKPIQVHVCRDQAADVARLEVIDHGPGIDPAMTKKIFEPFQRAVSPDAPIPGLGLGLYVVKMIVEGHGGHVNVESHLGEGSRFIVDLPCATPARA